jgi:hypothetical protein
MPGINPMNQSTRIILTRLLVSYILFFWLLRFFERVTPSGLNGPPLIYLGLDITYWMLVLSKLHALILYNPIGALMFDLLTFSAGILSILFPLQRKWIIPFAISQFLYPLLYNSVLMHHSHPQAGLMLVMIPFCFKDNRRFGLLWEGMRYYVCYVYAMSFVWKTLIGDSFYQWQHGVRSFKANMTAFLFHNQESLMAGIYRFLIRHNWILNTGNTIIFLLEGIMIIGFFSKKYDRWLFFCPIIIHLATYLFSDVFFMELLVLDFALLSTSQLNRIGQKWPLLLYPGKGENKYSGALEASPEMINIGSK